VRLIEVDCSGTTDQWDLSDCRDDRRDQFALQNASDPFSLDCRVVVGAFASDANTIPCRKMKNDTDCTDFTDREIVRGAWIPTAHRQDRCRSVQSVSFKK
jgi:hypothetical protein